MKKKTIVEAASAFVQVTTHKNTNTGRAYANGLKYFIDGLTFLNLDPDVSLAEIVTEDHILPLIDIGFFKEKDVKPLLFHLSASSQHLYCSAVVAFMEYLVDEDEAQVNLVRLRRLIRRRLAPRPETNPMAARDHLEKVIAHVKNLNLIQTDNYRQRLINMRDRAFTLTLSDTGYRVSEACGLLIKDIDLENMKTRIVGKGNKVAYVRYSKRALDAILEYLNERFSLDDMFRRKVDKLRRELPVFARHDKGAGKKVLQLSTDGGRHIIDTRVVEALGPEYRDTISPHTFRHYFVTSVLRGTGNMRLAQLLARHSSATTTEIYAHMTDDELDQAHYKIFNT